MRVAVTIATTALMVGYFSAVSWGYFVDTFDGPGLDGRWVSENSPSNPPGSDIAIVSGQAVGSGCKESLYNHLETPIYVAGNFDVQVDVRVDQGQNWGTALVLYWDTTHFIALRAPRNARFRTEVYDGSSFATTNSTLLTNGGQMATLRIEFTVDTIKFYAKNQNDPVSIHLSGLDIARTSAFAGTNALMIIGKGRQDNTLNTNPDFDNDYGFPGVSDQIILDNAIFQGSFACGDSGTVYLAADFDRNCKVDMGDVGELAGQWHWCSDLSNPDCDQFRQDGAFAVWQIDPYLNFEKDKSRGPVDPLVRDIEIKMAKGEYRDAWFMMGPYAAQRTFDIQVETSVGVPQDMILVEEILYLLNRADETTGDAVYPLAGNLVIPAGESRQVHLRFDARYSGVAAGLYAFGVTITDVNSQEVQVIPGTIEVWDFELPSYDVLPNNAYVEFTRSLLSGGQAFTNGVQEMKRYGVNMVNVHPDENPYAVDVDDNGNIITLNSSFFESRVAGALQHWQSLPGNEKLLWQFSISGHGVKLGMTRDDFDYPDPMWDTVFAQWITEFKSILLNLGIQNEDWTMAVSDEASATQLLAYDIPLAERIKSIDPNIRLASNSAKMIIYPTWADRYLAVFDVFQPHFPTVEADPSYLSWLRSSGKPVWTYLASADKGFTSADLYDYYRSYSWRMEKNEVTGIGLWSYCALNVLDPWGSTPNLGWAMVWKHWSTDEVVHSRRYAMYRETMDDFRYIRKLRDVAGAAGGSAPADAEALIDAAITDITTNMSDHTRCEQWRLVIAEEISTLLGLVDPTPDFGACDRPGTMHLDPDVNQDCYVNVEDFGEFTKQWLWCSDPTRPECDQYWQ